MRIFTPGLDGKSNQRGECPVDFWAVGVIFRFGFRFSGKSLIVGVAIILLFALEVIFVAVVATGR